jgi:hypothetical protein
MIESKSAIKAISSRGRANLVLIGWIVLCFSFNVATAWFFSGGHDNDWIEIVLIGTMVFQPIAVGLWAALAGGSTLINASLAAPCLVLLIVATGLDRDGFTDIQRGEAIAFAIAGLTVFAIAFVIFLVIRWLKRLRIDRHDSSSDASAPAFQFSIRFLLALTTLYALMLAILVRLSFDTGPPPSYFPLGPDFFIRILTFGGATFFAVVLPTMAIPLFILYGSAPRRLLRNAIVFWAFVTLLIAGIWGALEGYPLNVLMFMLLIQLGATIPSP